MRDLEIRVKLKNVSGDKKLGRIASILFLNTCIWSGKDVFEV